MCCVQSTRRKKLGVTQVWWYVTWRRLLTGSDYFRMVGFSDHTVIPTEAICRAIHSMISSVSRAYGRPVIQTQSNLPQRSFHNSAFFASTRTIYSVRSGSLVWFIILSVGCRRRILLVFLSVVTVVIIIIIVVLIFFFICRSAQACSAPGAHLVFPFPVGSDLASLGTLSRVTM